MPYVYLLECQHFYKIGIANDVASRLAQLSTGNPYEIKVLAVYFFENAAVVEGALHQRFSANRERGEWFDLGKKELAVFHDVCVALGGTANTANTYVTDNDIQEAEEMQGYSDSAKFDYSAMFADGWIMEVGNSKKGDWRWRMFEKGNKEFIYGGLIKNLPYSLENMRRVYRDGLEPVENE
jgi:hypothetical protein